MEKVIPEPSEEANEAELKAAFAEGFSETPTETPELPETPAPVEPQAVEVSPAPEPPAPKYVQLTEAEHADLLKLKSMMGKLDEGFGTLGNIHQIVKHLQSTYGQTVEATDEDLAELRADFPELAEMTKKAFNRVLGRIKRTASTAPSIDPDTMATQIETRLLTRQQHAANESLSDDHPNWAEIVGAQDSETPFRTWAATQSSPFQARLWSSNDPAFLSRTLTRFKTETTPVPKATPTKPNERTQRLTAAVTPRGVAPASAPPEESGFAEGFRSESKRLGLL